MYLDILSATYLQMTVFVYMHIIWVHLMTHICNKLVHQVEFLTADGGETGDAPALVEVELGTVLVILMASMIFRRNV